MKKGKTFVDYFKEAQSQKHPSVAFIDKIAELTHRTPIAVRNWLNGENTPDYNCQEIISNYLGEPREQLFPPKKKDDGKLRTESSSK